VEDAADAESPVGTPGAVVPEFTVSVTTPLVTVPAVLLTTTRNVEPLSVVAVAGVV
jgi:hypothetical protein